MAAKTPTPAGPKQFSLAAQETNLLIFTKTQLDAIWAAQLSVIAQQRLSYHVTENTQFEISPDMKTVKVFEADSKVVDKATGSGAIKTA